MTGVKQKPPCAPAAGALRDVDREELLNDIHRAREQASHGRPA